MRARGATLESIQLQIETGEQSPAKEPVHAESQQGPAMRQTKCCSKSYLPTQNKN